MSVLMLEYTKALIQSPSLISFSIVLEKDKIGFFSCQIQAHTFEKKKVSDDVLTGILL